MLLARLTTYVITRRFNSKPSRWAERSRILPVSRLDQRRQHHRPQTADMVVHGSTGPRSLPSTSMSPRRIWVWKVMDDGCPALEHSGETTDRRRKANSGIAIIS